MAAFWLIVLLGGAVAAAALIWPLRGQVSSPSLLAAGAVALLAAAGAYLVGGKPGLPGQPYAQRAAERASANPESLSPDEQFMRLEEVVRSRPNDQAGRRLYARELLRRGRTLEAVEAYRAAAAIEPNAEIYTELGEALIVMNEGEITPEAESAFRRAIEVDPQSLSPAFYLAAAAYNADPNAETAMVLADVAGQADANDARTAPLAAAIAARLARPRMGPETGQGPPPSIEAMVARLENRRDANPDDIGLWLSLARVRAALGDREAGLAILEEARGRFDSPGAQRVIAAMEAGLPSGAPAREAQP